MDFTTSFLYTLYMFNPCQISVTSITPLGSYFEYCEGLGGGGFSDFSCVNELCKCSRWTELPQDRVN